MDRCNIYLNIGQSLWFNFFYFNNEYFTLQITLIFALIGDQYFTICKIVRIIIILDFSTNNGYLLESIRILDIRIDFGMKSWNNINTWILAQSKKEILQEMAVLTTLPFGANQCPIVFVTCLYMCNKLF